MITESRDDVYSPAVLAPSGITILGTIVPFDQFDTTYHWEEVLVMVQLVTGATPPSGFTVDGILNLISNIKIEFNYGGLKTVVNASGVGMLEYCANSGLNLDAATLNLIAAHTIAAPTLVASSTYRLCYRIPLVHPMVTEPLRSRMLVPVPIHDAPPKITLTFSSAAAMHSAGAFTSILAQIYPLRREVPQALHDSIMKTGGYMPFDLLETLFTPGVGVSGTQHIPIIQPGAFGALQIRHYKGGASLTRADASLNTTAGQESIWAVQTSNKTYRRFHNKSLWTMNGWSRVLNTGVQASSPAIAGTPAASTLYPEPASLMLDFLTGNGIADANELGGTLDCFLPANPGQRMELVGDIASVATNSSLIYLMGHRYTDQNLVNQFSKV